MRQTKAEHPHVRHLRNGTLLEVPKTGTVKLTLAENQALEVCDKDGNLLFEVQEGGKIRAHGAVELGGDLSGLKKLIHEEAAAVYNGHTHQVTVPSGGAGGVVTSTGPSASIGAGHMTSDTKAK